MPDLPLDESTRYLTYAMLPKGGQLLVTIADCPSVVVIVNPDDGRKPYFYYRDDDVDNFEELEIGEE